MYSVPIIHNDFTKKPKSKAEAIRTMVVPISILIRTTVVPIRILIHTTGMWLTICVAYLNFVYYGFMVIFSTLFVLLLLMLKIIYLNSAWIIKNA